MWPAPGGVQDSADVHKQACNKFAKAYREEQPQ